jgi:hypothetical protein
MMVLQWCWYGVRVVLECCHYGAEIVLNGVRMVLNSIWMPKL